MPKPSWEYGQTLGFDQTAAIGQPWTFGEACGDVGVQTV